MAEINDNDDPNSINGTSGDDTIRGNGGNDTIDGGSGNDFVQGGEGDDSITGGAGDDTIIGGKGNDTMTAGNSSPTDTFVIRDGDGSDVITDFDPGEPDIIAFHMAEMNTFADVQARMSQVGGDTVITYDNGDTLTLKNVNMGDLSSTNFTFNTGPVCLHEGTLIQTATGMCRVEELRGGDLVMTLDAGPQPILSVFQRRYRFRTRPNPGQPILIQSGAFRAGMPDKDTIVSPQHRILLMRAGSGQEVLAPSKALTNRNGIRRMAGRSRATYYNLLLHGHHIIFANGLPVESLLLTPYTLKNLGLTRAEPTHPARPLVQKDPLGTVPQMQLPALLRA